MLQDYQANLKLVYDGVACKNEKPISCFSGGAPLAQIGGKTVAEFCADPLTGAQAAFAALDRIQEEAGPVHCFNSGPGGLNMVTLITMLWYSKVLIPGEEIPENSVWQVKEQKLVGREAYDEILEMGYMNFINQKVLPRIIDPDYLKKYLQYAGAHGAEISKLYADSGIVKMQCGMATMIPFEQLCGIRSMSQFYMDCYKNLDKLKEVSDFIFAETSAAKAKDLEKVKDNPSIVGYWVGGWRTASAMLNPKIWETLVWPYMKASAEQLLAYNKVPLMHLDQDWTRDIDRFGELPAGKIVLNTDAMTDLRVTRKTLPGYAIMGDVPPTLLTSGTPAQVEDYVKRLIDDLGPQGLFVCPGCDCPVGAKYENIAAMVKATNEWH